MSLYIWLFCFIFAAFATTSHAAPEVDGQTQYAIGYKFRKGIGVDRNPEIALEWYRKSAQQGFARGEYAVAWMLAFEEDDQTDYAAALPWLIKASGPHKTPQGPRYADIQKKANSRLRWMCKRGVVEFPTSHPLSKDPKCWLGRGNRLFQGRDKLGEFVGGRNYHVEQDYVAARLLLEKALASGEKLAAVNLANIYKSGLGTPKDNVKYEHYLQIAGETNHGKVNFFLAERAYKNKDTETYIRRLKTAATDGHSRAANRLGNLYFKGKLIEKDDETAFLYFFLGEKRQYFRSRNRKGGRWPGEHADMLAFFQTPSAYDTLEQAKTNADAFAKTNGFRKSSTAKIQTSYNLAMQDLYWIETGNDVRWYKDKGWTLFYIYGLIFQSYWIFALSFKFLTRRP